MLPTGWSASQQTTFNNLLYGNHTIRIGVRLLDLSHNYVSDLSSAFTGGSIAVDTGGDITDRALDLTLFDPTRKIHLDADSPSASSVFIANMISIMYSISDPYQSAWWNVPVFCGPLDQVTRDGVNLSITCLGKEKLMSDPVWVGRSWKKNSRKTDIIRALLIAGGETKMDIPDLPYRTKAEFSVKRDQNFWDRAVALAWSMGYHLFYDGRGVARMRDDPEKFNSISVGDGRLTPSAMPQFGYDLTSASNAVQVLGGKPKGAKSRISVKIVAPDSHPLSPKRVGRNGVPRYLNPIIIDDDTIKSKADALKLANKTLDAALLEAVSVSFDMLPNPLIEPRDVGYLNTDNYGTGFRFNQFSIPLLNTDNANVGYLKRQRTKGKHAITKRPVKAGHKR